MNACADIGNAKQFGAPLAEVFQRYYGADELWGLYTSAVGPLLGERIPEKAPRKEWLVSAFVKVLNDEDLGKRFFEALAPQVQKVLFLLAWDGDLELLKLEKEVGFTLAEARLVKPRDRYDYEREVIDYKTEFSLVGFDKSHYYQYSRNTPKEGIVVRLPTSLRNCFRKFLPLPKGYTLEVCEKTSEEALTYRCDETILEDMRFVADYINRGHLELLGSGKIKKGCLRTLSELLTGGEFFSGEKNPPKLESLRKELLISLLAVLDAKIRTAMLAEPADPKVIFRGLLTDLLKRDAFFHRHLLPHLSDGRGYLSYDKGETLGGIWKLFSELSPVGWVTWKNIEKYQYYHQLPLALFKHHGCTVTLESEEEYYDKRKVDVTVRNHLAFVSVPLLQGTAFLLAAMGFAEIAYTVPKNVTYKHKGDDFLTPWDGLVAVRLTPLGAYAFKQTEEVTLKVSQRKRAEVFLNPNRLTVTSRNLDPVTELSLLDFMEKLCDGCYRMTRKSFLRGCTTDASVQARIAQFKANISAEPPGVWKSFLDDLSRGVVALRCKNSYLVYELADTPELRRHFATDPVLKEKTLKVEGLRVAIAKTDLPLVIHRLAELGYLLQ
jgi:hypothetical protein